MVRQVLTLVAILAAFGINIWANLAPPSSRTIGDIANTLLEGVLIIPANYAFSIWGIIYLGLMSLAVYQALPSQRLNPHVQKLGFLLVIASLAQIIWIFLFQYQLFTASLVVMLLILIPLIVLYLRLDIGIKRVSRSERWLINLPISIYLAWISVATIVNAASVLYYRNWSGWGINDSLWTAIMLVVGAAIGAIVGWQRGDTAFVLVYVWAFIAIAVANFGNLLVAGTAGTSAIALILLAVWSYSVGGGGGKRAL